MSKIHCPPDGSMLHSLANANLKWWVVLGELIDNALDAGACTVGIELLRDGIRIEDDGHGCSNPIDMVRLGAHAKHDTTKLGRYGIGGKEAALWLGGEKSSVTIRTIHAGRRLDLHVNWEEYARNWDLDSPNDLAAAVGEAGSSIAIKPLQRVPPHGSDWQDLLGQLSYLYSPALKHGRQIKLKRPIKKAEWEPLTGWQLPEFQGEHVDARIVVNGRGGRVTCGVVRDGVPNPRGGFTYLHEWRVIEQASANGCGQYGAARVCGLVELDASWPLTKNKDAVSKGANELYAEVERVSRSVLERADKIGTELHSRLFDSAVDEQLNAFVNAQRAKAKRGRGPTTGTNPATGKGGKHRRAEHEQPGATFDASQPNRGPRPPGRYRVLYDEFGKPDEIGRIRHPGQVILNTDNRMVALIRHGESPTSVVILAACLIGAEHCYAPGGNLLLPGIEKGHRTEDFSKAVGSILSSATTLEQAAPVLKAV